MKDAAVMSALRKKAREIAVNAFELSVHPVENLVENLVDNPESDDDAESDDVELPEEERKYEIAHTPSPDLHVDMEDVVDSDDETAVIVEEDDDKEDAREEEDEEEEGDEDTYEHVAESDEDLNMSADEISESDSDSDDGERPAKPKTKVKCLPKVVAKVVAKVVSKRTANKRLKGSVLDKTASIQKYSDRIMAFDLIDLKCFDNTYICDFGLHQLQKGDLHHALVLQKILLDRGISVQGLVSENKAKGIFVDPGRNNVAVIYVGKDTRYTTLKPTTFSFFGTDLVYV
jgi:hypothetical protein